MCYTMSITPVCNNFAIFHALGAPDIVYLKKVYFLKDYEIHTVSISLKCISYFKAISPFLCCIVQSICNFYIMVRFKFNNFKGSFS